MNQMRNVIQHNTIQYNTSRFDGPWMKMKMNILVKCIIWNESIQVKSNQVKSKVHHLKWKHSSQVKSSQVKSASFEMKAFKSSQVKSSQAKSSQVSLHCILFHFIFLLLLTMSNSHFATFASSSSLPAHYISPFSILHRCLSSCSSSSALQTTPPRGPLHSQQQLDRPSSTLQSLVNTPTVLNFTLSKVRPFPTLYPFHCLSIVFAISFYPFYSSPLSRPLSTSPPQALS